MTGSGAAGPRTRTVAGAAGLELAVQEHGPRTAPAVVLMHGYPDNHAVWDLVVDRLVADHHVITYDVRGAGGSAVPSDRHGYRLEALVADLVAVIDAVSPTGPVHLAAHDWGSIQAWAAVTDPEVADRFRSFTSISGPSLDHVGHWMRARRRPGAGRWGELCRQLLHSWYIVAMQTPLARPAWRHGLGRAWPKLVARREHAVVDERWPGPHLVADAVHGVDLYRANMARSTGAPRTVVTDVPVQLIVPAEDSFVTPALLDGIEELAPTLVRRDVGGGHWLPRSKPDEVAGLIRAHLAAVEAGGRPTDAVAAPVTSRS